MNELIETVDIKKDYTIGEILTVALLVLAIAYYSGHVIIALL